MMCADPYVNEVGRAFGCGRCPACRINVRRLWARRMEFEADQYINNAFVTLTYAEENVPKDGSLIPLDLTNWLKRLRKSCPQKIRYFAVGEYGNDSWRPHYHAILFNYPGCMWGETRIYRERCCLACDRIRASWPFGIIQCVPASPATMAYCAGYVVKKMTHALDDRLQGRHPEFARMSRMPGIGAHAMDKIGYEMKKIGLVYNDVPDYLINNRLPLFMGRYLKERLRKEVFDVEGHRNARQIAYEKSEAELQPMREAAKALATSLKDVLVSKNANRRERMLNRGRIARKRRII